MIRSYLLLHTSIGCADQVPSASLARVPYRRYCVAFLTSVLVDSGPTPCCLSTITPAKPPWSIKIHHQTHHRSPSHLSPSSRSVPPTVRPSVRARTWYFP